MLQISKKYHKLLAALYAVVMVLWIASLFVFVFCAILGIKYDFAETSKAFVSFLFGMFFFAIFYNMCIGFAIKDRNMECIISVYSILKFVMVVLVISIVGQISFLGINIIFENKLVLRVFLYGASIFASYCSMIQLYLLGTNLSIMNQILVWKRLIRNKSNPLSNNNEITKLT